MKKQDCPLPIIRCSPLLGRPVVGTGRMRIYWSHSPTRRRSRLLMGSAKAARVCLKRLCRQEAFVCLSWKDYEWDRKRGDGGGIEMDIDGQQSCPSSLCTIRMCCTGIWTCYLIYILDWEMEIRLMSRKMAMKAVRIVPWWGVDSSHVVVGVCRAMSSCRMNYARVSFNFNRQP